MHDGRTRKVETLPPVKQAPFLASHRATLTILRGPVAGMEIELERARTTIGRGDHVDLRIECPSVSSEHASIEADSVGIGIRDLASTNGVQLNGASVVSADLKHGDRIVLGDCELQVVIEKREQAPRTWTVDDAD